MIIGQFVLASFKASSVFKDLSFVINSKDIGFKIISIISKVIGFATSYLNLASYLIFAEPLLQSDNNNKHYINSYKLPIKRHKQNLHINSEK